MIKYSDFGICSGRVLFTFSRFKGVFILKKLLYNPRTKSKAMKRLKKQSLFYTFSSKLAISAKLRINMKLATNIINGPRPTGTLSNLFQRVIHFNKNKIHHPLKMSTPAIQGKPIIIESCIPEL